MSTILYRQNIYIEQPSVRSQNKNPKYLFLYKTNILLYYIHFPLHSSIKSRIKNLDIGFLSALDK